MKIEENIRASNQGGLGGQLKSLEDNLKFLGGAFGEYSSGFLSRVHQAENVLYSDVYNDVLDKTSGEVLKDSQKVLENLRVVDLALRRLDAVIGGQVFDGGAITPDGFKAESGKFVLLGPQAFFSQSDVSGIALTMASAGAADLPTVFDMGADAAAGIKSVADGGEGVLPFDPTLGKAIQIAKSKETVSEHVAKGGAVGYTIVGLGLLALVIGLFKWIEISSYSVPSTGRINSILGNLMAGKKSAAEQQANGLKGTAGEMIRIGVDRFEGKREIVEELFFEKLLAIRPKLERMLPFLAVTAAAAPLMGLLGTVMGMIKTFKMIELFSASDPKTLSGGISEALVTTELGLVVAIPTLIIHGILSRMARGKVGRMEAAGVAFLNGMSECQLKAQLAAAAPSTPKGSKKGKKAEISEQDKGESSDS